MICMAGRPTKFKVEFNEAVYRLCLLGHTDAELAKSFEIEESTLNLWKTAHPEFMESIKRGKEIADIEVVESLRKRALGYKYEETTYEKINVEVDGVEDETDLKQEAYKKKVVTKEVAPDVIAQIFWLKNRQKKKWRDRVEQGFTDGDGNDVQPVIYIPDNGRKRNQTAERVSGKGT